MAFTCILSQQHASGQFFFSPISYSVLIPVGYDDDPCTDKFYNLIVAFDLLPGTNDLDFSFGIIEYDGETDTEYTYWSGRDVANFIRADDRGLIRGALLAATERLLNQQRPQRFLMCTRDVNAPQKAHTKFMLLGHLFKSCGYVVANADPYHGQQVWWMERNDPPTA